MRLKMGNRFEEVRQATQAEMDTWFKETPTERLKEILAKTKNPEASDCGTKDSLLCNVPGEGSVLADKTYLVKVIEARLSERGVACISCGTPTLAEECPKCGSRLRCHISDVSKEAKQRLFFGGGKGRNINNPRRAEGRQYQEFCDELSRKNEERYRAEHPESVISAGGRTALLMPFSELHMPPAPSDGDCWGPWKYHRTLFTLDYEPRDRHWRYQIDLEECTSSAQMLDWIFQVSNKVARCLSREDVGHLIQALQDLLWPQANLCSFGSDKRMDDPAEYLRKHTNSKSREESAA